MNKYLFQALTQSEESSGHSGYEITIYDDNDKDAYTRAVHYFNDPSRKVSLVAFAHAELEIADDGSTTWAVFVNNTKVAVGSEEDEEAAEKAASDYVIYEVSL